MRTPNEDFYLARVQEILDGHPALSSFVFFEYKNQPSLTPPVGELAYAIPSLLLNVSPADILIASRFFLPFILFILMYFLIYRITASSEPRSSKINAIAGALLVTLGYDLVDYRNLWLLLKGAIEPGGFLLWARPVRPIVGVILLTSFLLLILPILRKAKKQKVYIFGASLLLAMMFPSGFFDWGMALSVLAVAILIYFFKKEYNVVKNLATVVFSSLFLSAPYWYLVWRASSHPWYKESALRTGLFYTHYPLLNKFILAVLAVFLVALFLSLFKNKNNNFSFREKIDSLRDWHWISLIFILASLWAYSQQIVTGVTIWPYHFVQYTIPFGIIVLIVTFYNVVKEWSKYVWGAGIAIFIACSLIFGVYIQAGAYFKFYSRYASLQSYTSLFDWLNEQEKDCAVLIGNTPDDVPNLDVLILAFTHCNLYNSNMVASFLPDERVYHSYFIHLFFSGVTSDNIGQYVRKNENEVRGHLSTNWKSLYGVKDFPDFQDTELKERIENLPRDYKVFLSDGLKSGLDKYRLDYILVSKPLGGEAALFVADFDKVFEGNGVVIHSYKK